MKDWRRKALAVASAVVLAGLAVFGGGASGPLATRTQRFDILIGKRVVGEMYLEIMTIQDLTILKEEFTAPFRTGGESHEAGFDTQVVYRGTKRPAISRGEATTRIGTFKIMEGKVTFDRAEGQWTAKAEATGYADKERRPFENARTWTRTLSTGGDLLLTHAAFICFAPKLLDAPGKIENVVHVELPDDIGFPELLNFQPGCVLERHATTTGGKVDITLHRVFAGGNIVPLLKMTVDGKGEVVTMQLGKFTLRPKSFEGG